MTRSIYTSFAAIVIVLTSFGCSTSKKTEQETAVESETAETASTDAVPAESTPEAATETTATQTAETQTTETQASTPAANEAAPQTNVAATQTAGETPAAPVETAQVQPAVEVRTEIAPSDRLETPEPAREVAAAPTNATSRYRVRNGDTLMKIAYETYGDVFKWRKIFEMNRDTLTAPYGLKAGTVLKLDREPGTASLERNGQSYLIQRGDTLGTISGKVYGTPAKWRKIYANNRALIKNPNKIFAGFFLYYVPETPQTLSRSNNNLPSNQRMNPAQDQSPKSSTELQANATTPTVSAPAGRSPAATHVAAPEPAAKIATEKNTPTQGQTKTSTQ